MSTVLESGTIESGRSWWLVTCDKPDKALVSGRHLILTIEPPEGTTRAPRGDLTSQETKELRLLAFSLAEKYESEPERSRLDFNNAKVAQRKTAWHAHLKLPAGDDKLSRLIGE